MPAAGSAGAPASLAARASRRLSMPVTLPARASRHLEALRADRRRAHAALRLADRLQLPPGPAVGQDGSRLRGPVADRARAGELEHLAGEKDRPLPQVRGRIAVAAGHGHDVPCLERGPDAPADRLRAVRDDRAHHQPHVASRRARGGGRARAAASSVRTLAVGPTGMSMTTWVEPAATFFDSTDATSCASLSRSRARSTRISRSSTGLR